MKIGLNRDDGKVDVLGDSGWVENTVTNDGLNNYIAASVGAVAGSKQFLYMVLATQTAAVSATATSLSGEVANRKAVSASTIATGTFQATASWSSSDITTQYTIGAVGMYNTSSGGTLGAGQTFATSVWATNQNVSATYQLRFS
uniref:Uncharacterized protein n=1 Tax=candidate division CPR3 bacterium TaxID=2268181 RepID=A0A7V3JA87_UNCC3